MTLPPADNNNGIPMSGTTAQRPVNADVGSTYYDETTEELLVWTGTVWSSVGEAGNISADSITGGDSSLGITGLAGTAGSSTTPGGAGGAIPIAGGAGGAKSGTGAAAGGAGGAVSLAGGAGGATASSSSNAGGAGASATITGGAGGAATAGTGNGGAGGDVALNPGAGGATTGGAAGAPGRVKVGGSGLFAFANAQAIAMNDAQVVLTVVPGTPAGVLLTSTVLFVDAESGSEEDLLLPPEANCNGMVLLIANTGDEPINVKDDSDSNVIVRLVGSTSFAIVFCNGTKWVGGLLQYYISDE